MVAGLDQGDEFIRDMGYSLTEFHRILPSAVGDYAHRVEGNRVVIDGAESGQQLTLDLKVLPDRQIGMIRIPHMEVKFDFQNFPMQERKNFMVGFDRSYQRGGG